AQSVNQQMGSGENIRRFAANPLTTDDQMSTFDGKKNFDFTLQCKGSNKFLNMMVQPKSNGNLTLRTIQQDTSMNGEFDTVLTPNYEMTGICSNGFLKCDNPATGEGCTSYKWTASSNSMLG
ncbi:conjugal transfer protein TraN, partial [Vibrio anguillarum]